MSFFIGGLYIIKIQKSRQTLSITKDFLYNAGLKISIFINSHAKKNDRQKALSILIVIFYPSRTFGIVNCWILAWLIARCNAITVRCGMIKANHLTEIKYGSRGGSTNRFTGKSKSRCLQQFGIEKNVKNHDDKDFVIVAVWDPVFRNRIGRSCIMRHCKKHTADRMYIERNPFRCSLSDFESLPRGQSRSRAGFPTGGAAPLQASAQLCPDW